MDLQKKLKRAWELTPDVAKSKVFEQHTKQNISDAIKNGRRDESVLEAMLNSVKKASAEALEELKRNNEEIQNL